jgi:very-short-patch-repair endonuclease
MANELAFDVHIDRESQVHWIDRLIAALAGRQHGVVARWQLLARGIGPGAVDFRVKRGRLHVLHRGVYAVGHRSLSTHGQWMARVLSAGPGAVLSHRSAGALSKIASENAMFTEVTARRHLRDRRGLRFYASDLPPDEITTRFGIPTTTVPRTLLDLAAVDRRIFERALHEAEVQNHYDRLSLPDLIARYPHRRGIATVRSVLRRSEPIPFTRGEFEEAMLAFVHNFDLPVPRFNAWILLNGRWIEVDCLWEAQRVILECDDRKSHDTTKRFESDRLRDRKLRVAGWDPIRITWRQLHDEPEEIAADLRELLGA